MCIYYEYICVYLYIYRQRAAHSSYCCSTCISRNKDIPITTEVYLHCAAKTQRAPRGYNYRAVYRTPRRNRDITTFPHSTPHAQATSRLNVVFCDAKSARIFESSRPFPRTRGSCGAEHRDGNSAVIHGRNESHHSDPGPDRRLSGGGGRGRPSVGAAGGHG